MFIKYILKQIFFKVFTYYKIIFSHIINMIKPGMSYILIID